MKLTTPQRESIKKINGLSAFIMQKIGYKKSRYNFSKCLNQKKRGNYTHDFTEDEQRAIVEAMMGYANEILELFEYR